MKQKYNQYRVDLLEIKLDNLSDAVVEGFREQKNEYRELKDDIR